MSKPTKVPFVFVAVVFPAHTDTQFSECGKRVSAGLSPTYVCFSQGLKVSEGGLSKTEYVLSGDRLAGRLLRAKRGPAPQGRVHPDARVCAHMCMCVRVCVHACVCAQTVFLPEERHVWVSLPAGGGRPWAQGRRHTRASRGLRAWPPLRAPASKGAGLGQSSSGTEMLLAEPGKSCQGPAAGPLLAGQNHPGACARARPS